jgi:hypothetical protein
VRVARVDPERADDGESVPRRSSSSSLSRRQQGLRLDDAAGHGEGHALECGGNWALLHEAASATR